LPLLKFQPSYIVDVINYILASFKFGVPTPWEWHRHTNTCTWWKTILWCMFV